MDVFYCLFGLVLLFWGGEWLVSGAVSIAVRLGLSTLLVSAVVVGFGTSAPELIVSVEAAMKGTPDIAVGNVVGSNIANILFILGIAATLNGMKCHSAGVRRDALAILVAATVPCAAAWAGHLGLTEGLLMLAALAAYLYYTVNEDIRTRVLFLSATKAFAMACGKKQESLYRGAGLTAIGLVLLTFGAHCLIEGATSLARGAGIPEAVIGLTLVALGTSLPELATAIISAMKKQTDVVIGNVLGSNLFNTLGILGVTATLGSVPIEGRIATVDVWVMLGVTAALYALIRWRGHLGHFTGTVFIAAYAGYTAWLFLTD